MAQGLVKEKGRIAGKFEIWDLGEVRWFLAMEITHDQIACMIMIDQHQYIQKILGWFGLHNSHPVSMPMAANLRLPKLDAPMVDPWLYQSMLGSLMYAVIRTHPNIMFTVHYLSQHSVAPGMEHLTAIKWVYWYLNGTVELGLQYQGKLLNQGKCQPEGKEKSGRNWFRSRLENQIMVPSMHLKWPCGWTESRSMLTNLYDHIRKLQNLDTSLHPFITAVLISSVTTPELLMTINNSIYFLNWKISRHLVVNFTKAHHLITFHDDTCVLLCSTCFEDDTVRLDMQMYSYQQK